MAATAVVSRENIESWADGSPKLRLFRRAVEEMQKLSEIALMDSRGYQWVAGVHGGFGNGAFCQHGNRNFLTWHRAYLLDMELKLRAQIAEIADVQTADEWRLPYWDWTAPNATLPKAFTDATYDDGGTQKPNPLLSQPYQLGQQIFVRPGVLLNPQTPTWRGPVPPGTYDGLGDLVADALEEDQFGTFSDAVENPHNLVHVRTGGHMVTFRSSFDPIFWVHHANVDFQFWQWQQRQGGIGTFPQDVLDFECQPFQFADLRASAFLDTRTLGYTYATVRSPVLDRAALPDADERTELTIRTGPIPDAFTRARINLHNVHHPEDPVVLRFFADRDTPADASTPTTPDEHFLIDRAVLGHGPCPGAPGHCDPTPLPITGAGLRAPHHLAPFDIGITVTRNLRAAIGAGPGHTVSMIALDQDGEQVPLSALRFDNATVTVT
ncbi:MAG: tyrosinase family protein [Actinomycetota bacterium]|nr:tyrosinase family protein [Actinomycetota bacterium]